MSLVSTGEYTATNIKLPGYNEKYSEEMCNYFLNDAPKLLNWLKQEVIINYKKIAAIYWKKSAYSSVQAIAYRGIIMPKFIEEVQGLDYNLKNA